MIVERFVRFKLNCPMKKYQLKITSNLHARLQSLCGPEPGTLFIGFDIELGGAAICASWNGSAPTQLGKDTREGILHALEWLVAKGVPVCCVQEACGFGYGFHRDLVKLGVQSLVVAPEVLNGKRKTDKSDTYALCRKLLDYQLSDDKKRLRVVRVPTIEQERKRALWRQRHQLIKSLNMLVAHGRALLLEHGVYQLPERWWGKRLWPKLMPTLDPWLVTMLEPHRKIILSTMARIQELDKQVLVEKKGPAVARPIGLGRPTQLQLEAEILDWSRFKNRKQVGSFIGCCPSEESSGGNRRQGAIDRMGSARIRSILVEAVWRLVRWNSQWRGIQKFAHVLAPGAKAGPAARKKAVIACARLLAIDLWRIHTGQLQPEDIGLKTVSPSMA